MKIDDGPYCKCDSCEDIYVLIDGYNDDKQCFWCKKGIRVQKREPNAETH